jgi:hypothetical protein
VIGLRFENGLKKRELLRDGPLWHYLRFIHVGSLMHPDAFARVSRTQNQPNQFHRTCESDRRG